MTLSKSDYMLFLRHPAWLWLKKFNRTKLPLVDDNLQALFDAGHEFEKYAEKLFPDTVKVGFDIKNFSTYKSMPARTKKELDSGASAILQGRFEIDGITCIFDVLKKVKENTYDLIEIKSSTKAKPEHEYDLAFQVVVLEKMGIKIRNISVMHVNKEYIRKGAIEPDKLVSQTDITSKVRDLVDITEEQIKNALNVLSLDDMPDISPSHVNRLEIPRVQWMYDWMEIYKVLKPKLDKYSIYNLSYPTAKQIGLLEEKRIEFIKDVPVSLALREKQVVQIKTTKDDKRIVDRKRIKDFIDTFKYPLYFFDYETFSSAIPAFDGCRPYGDYPFQYSLHVKRTPSAKLEHFEYLHSSNSNPMPELLKQLERDTGDTGTVLTWYMSYEKGCNDRMGELYPEHKEFLKNLNKRIVDLITPFSKMWFFDKDFFGSASIKMVMPVLAPDLSYKELNINDGLFARRLWTQTILEDKNKGKRDETMHDLSKYCTLDTFAMVRILEELEKII